MKGNQEMFGLRSMGERAVVALSALASLSLVIVFFHVCGIGSVEEVTALLNIHGIGAGSDFLPQVTGGIDANLSSTTHPLLFVENKLAQVFPDLKSFYLFNKLVVALTAWAATFVFARQTLRASPTLAGLLGCCYVVATPFELIDTVKFFVAYALLPLAPALLTARLSWPRFLAAALAYAVAVAVSADPIHLLLALVPSLTAVALLLPGIRWQRYLCLLGLVCTAFSVNWSVSLYTYLMLFSASERLTTFAGVRHFGLHPVLSSIYQILVIQAPLSLAIPAALAVFLGWDRRRLLVTLLGLGVLFAPMFHRVIQVAPLFPPLGFLDTLHSEDVGYGLPVLSIALLVIGLRRGRAALCAGVFRPRWRRTGPRWLAVAACLLALTATAVGGAKRLLPLAAERGATLGSDPAWVFAAYPPRFGLGPEAEGGRVVTYPCKIHPLLPALAGFDTLDGFSFQPLSRQRDLWLAIARDVPENVFFSIVPAGDDRRCQSDPPAVLSQVDFSLLSLMNAAYIISTVDLADPRLSLERTVTARLDGGGEGLIRLYRFGTPLPRAYAAQVIRPDDASVPPTTIARAVLDHHVAYVAAVDGGFQARPDNEVQSLIWTGRGYRIQMSRSTGGTVVINHALSPLWRAQTADGIPLVLAAANRYHMAIAIPPGTEEVFLVYKPDSLLPRPLIWLAGFRP